MLFRLSTIVTVVLLLVFSLGALTWASGNDNDSEKEVEKSIEEQLEMDPEELPEQLDFTVGPFRPSRFVGNYGLGYVHLREIEALNERTPGEFPDLEAGMVVRRWHYTFGTAEGLRLGWTKMYGSESRAAGSGEDYRKISYELEMGGFFVEQSIYLDQYVDLGLGAAFGRGTHGVNLLFYQPKTDANGDPWQEAVSSNLQQNFYFLQPQANAQIRVFGPFHVNLQGGYTLTVGRDLWDIEGQEIIDHRHRADGFHFSAGLGIRF